MSLSIRWLPRFTLVSQMFLTVRERLKVLWPRIYRQRFALLVMMFASGIKASLTSARCVARLVIVLRTVPLMVCAVAAVNLHIWLPSMLLVNRMFLPLLPIPFRLYLILFLRSTHVLVSSADPSMSTEDEESDPDFVDLCASEPGSCSGDDDDAAQFQLFHMATPDYRIIPFLLEILISSLKSVKNS